MCWRVRTTRGATGTVDLSLLGSSTQKLMQAGTAWGYLSERRVASPLLWLFYPREARLISSTVNSITVQYPPARIAVFGLGFPWLVWFCIVSFLAMLAFRKRLRVTF